MTASNLNQETARLGDEYSRTNERDQNRHESPKRSERAVSVAAGTLLTVLGLSRASLPGLLVAGVGGAMACRGLQGRTGVMRSLGMPISAKVRNRPVEVRMEDYGVHVEQAFLINRPPEDLYNFWRDFQNLPQIMNHLERVEVRENNQSHWVAKVPRIFGGMIEWDAQITADEPHSRIAWKSLPGSQIDTVGEIRFSPGLGDRGTEVHVSMEYVPPAGKVGHWIATLFGQNPRRQMREDLRNFKRLMEIGELPTITGQPRGTCSGSAAREA